MFAPRSAIAVHPGEILQELLAEHRLTQSLLATHLGMQQSKINEICRGKRGISSDMAARLGKVFNQSPMFWLNLQKNWELSQLNESDYASITPLIESEPVLAEIFH
ncbi:MAG: HigA family addiction module antitoxin [Caldilineaceae bacterium]|nr:HigA family addiction module antidote protein [Caldilineaceae bacterium]